MFQLFSTWNRTHLFVYELPAGNIGVKTKLLGQSHHLLSSERSEANYNKIHAALKVPEQHTGFQLFGMEEDLEQAGVFTEPAATKNPVVTVSELQRSCV